MSPTSLSRELLASRLRTERYGRSIELEDVTASTNDDARRAALAGAPNGHVVVADAQSAGRGSRGRHWISPAGTDLYLSIVARLALDPDRLPPLTLAVGLGVSDAVDACLPSGVRSQVKWPNDVWVGERKIAGILVESSSMGDAPAPIVIGIGLNVNRPSFAEGFETPPTSLRMEAGQDAEREAVLAEVLWAVERWVERFEREGVAPVVRALEARLALRGARVTCDGLEGTVLGVTERGALRLETERGERDVFSGSPRRLD